jgi:hypothetical protein
MVVCEYGAGRAQIDVVQLGENRQVLREEALKLDCIGAMHMLYRSAAGDGRWSCSWS